MIVAKLVLHNRNIRNALGTQASGLYKAVITVLIESSAIYAITSLLFFGPWVAKNNASDIFLPILAQAQVRFYFPGAPRSQWCWYLMIKSGHRPVPHRDTNGQPALIKADKR